MVEPQSSKLITRVRFPSAPPMKKVTPCGWPFSFFIRREQDGYRGPRQGPSDGFARNAPALLRPPSREAGLPSATIEWSFCRHHKLSTFPERSFCRQKPCVFVGKSSARWRPAHELSAKAPSGLHTCARHTEDTVAGRAEPSREARVASTGVSVSERPGAHRRSPHGESSPNLTSM